MEIQKTQSWKFRDRNSFQDAQKTVMDVRMRINCCCTKFLWFYRRKVKAIKQITLVVWCSLSSQFPVQLNTDRIKSLKRSGGASIRPAMCCINEAMGEVCWAYPCVRRGRACLLPRNQCHHHHQLVCNQPLHSTTATNHCTPPQQPTTALHHSNQPLHSTTATNHCTPPQQPTTALHHSNQPLHSTTATNHCTPPQQPTTALHHSNQPLHSTTATNHCTPPQQPTTALHHSNQPLHSTTATNHCTPPQQPTTALHHSNQPLHSTTATNHCTPPQQPTTALHHSNQPLHSTTAVESYLKFLLLLLNKLSFSDTTVIEGGRERKRSWDLSLLFWKTRYSNNLTPLPRTGMFSKIWRAILVEVAGPKAPHWMNPQKSTFPSNKFNSNSSTLNSFRHSIGGIHF